LLFSSPNCSNFSAFAAKNFSCNATLRVFASETNF
jgi:hypothetical protein